MARATILELAVETRLHFCLLQKHLLSHLVHRLLIFDGHGICHASYLLSRLGHLSLDVFPLALTLRKTLPQICVNLTHVVHLRAHFLQFSRQVLL